MSVLKLSITSARPIPQLEEAFETPGGKHSITQRLINFLTSLNTGTELGAVAPPSILISIQENEKQASGTFTLISVAATNSASINGVAFTAVASGAGPNQFNVGANNNLTAANLAAAINASTTNYIKDYVKATANLNIVTVTSDFYGLAGNRTTIASASPTIIASGTVLTGGTLDPKAQLLSY